MPSSSRKTHLHVQDLEARAVPAVVASLSAGTLAVTGTVGNDTLTVRELPGARLVVPGVMIQYNGQLFNTIPTAWASRVYVFGSDGNDTINVSSITRKATIIGGRGHDTITSGAGNDDLYGRDGNDVITGGLGNDSLYGENGNDTINADAGNDSLFGGAGDDTMAGGDGNDRFFAEAGDDSLSGGLGNDTLRAGGGADVVFGGDGTDYLFGEADDDALTAEAGNDYLSGGDGRDSLAGGVGNDEMYGDRDNDRLEGGDGDDTARGAQGDDNLSGGAGNDRLFGEDGDDTLGGDDGNDIAAGGNGLDVVNGGTGTDTVSGNFVGDIVNGGGDPGDVELPGDGGGGGNSNGDPGGGNPGGGNTGGSTVGTVLQVVRSNWGAGATTDITVRNTGTRNMVGWTVEFDAPFNITEVWNAQLVSRAGNHYVFRNIPGFWNATIRPNATVTFGFNATFEAGTDTNIQNVKLNGTAVDSTGGANPGTGNTNFTATVNQSVRATWPDGSTHDVTIQNTGTTAINGWTVTFDAPFEITSVWNAQLVSRVGNTYTIRNIPNFWNARIAPGTGIAFGFNTRFAPGTSLEISNITLNGRAL